MKNNAKMWGGCFTKQTNELVDKYNASISFDYKLAKYDILGSIAHVKMLGHCSILSKSESDLIIQGLIKIYQKVESNLITFQVTDEDIHLNIERLLFAEIGEVAGKIHTGRSRNDQVALDLHLYLREKTLQIIKLLLNFLEVLHKIAAENLDTILPGYTHLQRAEPIRLAHHMLAYFNMFARDVERLCDSFKRINICPLGAGALAGSGIDVDCEYVAELLGFKNSYANSLDAVSDRDFIVEFLANSSLIMMHISKLSEELILWCSQEFSFIKLDDAFCTGSSMMPQKKNPDICELARGKTGRVYGELMALLTTLKGLPLAYNKDLQEDKEGLFDCVETLTTTLSIFVPMLETMQINKTNMLNATINDYANATTLANYLTLKDIPFRQAHAITGEIVAFCIEKQKFLHELDLNTYQKFSSKITQDIYEVINIENVIETHKTKCGTAKQQVQNQLNNATKVLTKFSSWYLKNNKLLKSLQIKGDDYVS